MLEWHNKNIPSAIAMEVRPNYVIYNCINLISHFKITNISMMNIKIFLSVSGSRRRLRRPKPTSTSLSTSNDQEVSSSITKFRRTRPNLRKASENSVVSDTKKKDKDGYKIVCYYTNWSQYRLKIGKFTPEDIIPDLCTHIIFAFGWLKKGKLSSFESNDETKDGKVGLYERILKLKKANPSLKTLLAIGKYII